MAEIYAVQNGNWSDGSTWSSGTVPTADDDVYLNGKTVNITVTPIEANKISNKTCPTTQISGGTITRSVRSVLIINADIEGNGTTLLNIQLNYVGWVINGNCTQDGSLPLINGGSCVYNGNDFIINGNCNGVILSCSLYENYSDSNASIYINGNYTGRIMISDTNPPSEPINALAGIYINGNFNPKFGKSVCAVGTYTLIYGVYNDEEGNCSFGDLHLFNNTHFHSFPKVNDIVPEEQITISIKTQYLELLQVQSNSFPQENQVAQGVIYGMQNEYEGRLQLPAEGVVVKGVEYGDKVGTLEVIALSGATAQAEDISVVNLTEQQLQRVGNCATVSTVQKCFEEFKE